LQKSVIINEDTNKAELEAWNYKKEKEAHPIIDIYIPKNDLQET